MAQHTPANEANQDKPWWHEANLRESTKYLFSSDIDLNHKDNFSETLLHWCLRDTTCKEIIINLIARGAHVNVANDIGETPLHLAILRPTTHIARELILKGADINAQDSEGKTPLHDAVETKNLEAVSMLLYHGADVNLLDEENNAPLMFALSEPPIADIIFPLYDNFSVVSVCGCSPVIKAAQCKSPIAVKLVKAGADVNFLSEHNPHLIALSLKYDSAELFKSVWEKFDYETFKNEEEPFLCQYIRLCNFSATEYIKGLYLILQSSFALNIMRDCVNFQAKCGLQRRGFFHDLLLNFNVKNIEKKDRLAIINLCLTLGATVNVYDVNLAYITFGFGQELEQLIYSMHSFKRAYGNSGQLYLVVPFILGVESEHKIEIIHDLALAQIDLAKKHSLMDSIGHFYLPPNLKLKLYNSLKTCNDNNYRNRLLVNKLSIVPKFPSLLELSRCQVRKYIKKNCPIKAPYHFHDAVKSLEVPQSVKDVILYKRSIYN